MDTGWHAEGFCAPSRRVRTGARCGRVAGEIREGGGAAGTCVLDLREGPNAEKLVEATVHTFGGLDILVNNAGPTRRAAFLELTEADWSDGFALKFFGAVRLIRHAWPHLKQRSGSVVNIAGIGGRTPGAAFALGGSVNAALLSLTKALADLGVQDQVQVNAINPGAIRTDRLNVRLQAIAREHHVSMEEAAFLRLYLDIGLLGPANGAVARKCLKCQSARG